MKSLNEIKEMVEKELGSLAIKIVSEVPNVITINVEVQNLFEVASKLNHMGFDHVKAVTGTDYPAEKKIELTYHVSSYTDMDLAKVIIALKARLDRSNPKVTSLVKVWPSAEYLERETYDLVGVIFEGHPKLERLLLPSDWDQIPPLLKEFKIKTEGIDA
ncbi:MAG: NADH-quinone oxidoreductase subunit C [Nitrososphaerota archaeon]|nr:NADH-quinone oxidoreductase subunit C [Nitrososphaerales archaeon]MDW8044368.1 NADH-quinone oxidoreductase subunit C [Nitrososphaerota archaeon]